jgi:nicotinic acid mononucleotide adenylyltransferase
VSLSLLLGAMIFGGVISGIRGCLYPKGEIGIFFGTFNPFHVTHVAIIKRTLEERGLYKVFIHSTVVPRLHATALRWGETRVSKFDCRLYILERT